jgi:hypothetical protein
MVGKKSREQQLRIIEKRVNTKDAGKDFDPRPDLERQERGLPPIPEATAKTASDPSGPDDRSMPRGLNQQSEHHKRRPGD